MQRGRKLVAAVVLALGLVGAAGFAPEATMAKTHSVARHADDHGRHGKDDKGGHGHGKDDSPNHH